MFVRFFVVSNGIQFLLVASVAIILIIANSVVRYSDFVVFCSMYSTSDQEGRAESHYFRNTFLVVSFFVAVVTSSAVF